MRASFLFAVFALGGCSGTASYIIDNYSGVQVEKHVILPKDGQRYVETPNGPQDMSRTYMIFDKPEDNRLMIWASAGAALGDGVMKAMIGVDTSAPIMVYRDAVEDFFRAKGRPCKPSEVYPFDKYRYEVRYLCAEPAPPLVAATKPKKT
ncbi:hypothetical protein [Prosthecomicrobium hirschii]|uniref:hypothetical protein n=1 Tax=Prosthecodimorpha hirschii TaxID=665126 RepID=UPI00221ECCDF|nr:hypothetical protein [Prosthecomicrobium hirschii]MCW1844140.1 hypothetical protein [Prosthecomicrobium hirschii]